jgi:hypothetical protein
VGGIRIAALAACVLLVGCAASREARLREQAERTVAGFSASVPELDAHLAQAAGWAVFPRVGADPSSRRDAGLLYRPGEDPLPCTLVRPLPGEPPAGVVYHEMVLLTAEDLATLLAARALDLPDTAEVYDWAGAWLDEPGAAPATAGTRRITTTRSGLLFAEPVHGQRLELR